MTNTERAIKKYCILVGAKQLKREGHRCLREFLCNGKRRNAEIRITASIICHNLVSTHFQKGRSCICRENGSRGSHFLNRAAEINGPL